MTIRGLLLRLIFTGLLAWILFSFTSELGSSLYLAAMPVVFHEMLRKR